MCPESIFQLMLNFKSHNSNFSSILFLFFVFESHRSKTSKSEPRVKRSIPFPVVKQMRNDKRSPMKFEFFLHFLSVDCQFNCASQNVKQCQIAKFWPGLRMLQWQSTLRYKAAFIISGQSDKNKTNLQRKSFLRGVCSVASVLDL